MNRYDLGYERRVAYHYDLDLIDRNFAARPGGYGRDYSRARGPRRVTPQGYALEGYDREFAWDNAPGVPGTAPYDLPFRPRTSSYWRARPAPTRYDAGWRVRGWR